MSISEKLADALDAWDGKLMLPEGWRQAAADALRREHDLSHENAVLRQKLSTLSALLIGEVPSFEEWAQRHKMSPEKLDSANSWVRVAYETARQHNAGALTSMCSAINEIAELVGDCQEWRATNDPQVVVSMVKDYLAGVALSTLATRKDMTTSTPYTAAIRSDGKHHVAGPGNGGGFYHGTLWKRLAFDTAKDAEVAAEIANTAYQEGMLFARQEIRQALGLKDA